ncbi:hypothetical protein AS189_18675 [Arthrobacter alpinus]|uniref:Uncharacterized protein n=1 Tax=Arthrobacter alpinus TaxID=656366 RepID=A0A0S2M3H2_9MICC|nr:hypothetical protein AS189_18675 [Arthrobacter alpinus]
MAIWRVFSVASVGLAAAPAVAAAVDGPLDAPVTGDGVADVGAAVSAGAELPAWLHPVSTSAAVITAPAHMVIFRRVLRMVTYVPQDLVRRETSDETANFSESI